MSDTKRFKDEPTLEDRLTSLNALMVDFGRAHAVYQSAMTRVRMSLAMNQEPNEIIRGQFLEACTSLSKTVNKMKGIVNG